MFVWSAIVSGMILDENIPQKPTYIRIRYISLQKHQNFDLSAPYMLNALEWKWNPFTALLVSDDFMKVWVLPPYAQAKSYTNNLTYSWERRISSSVAILAWNKAKTNVNMYEFLHDWHLNQRTKKVKKCSFWYCSLAEKMYSLNKWWLQGG